ncbi:MAG: TonB-dependent receptor plug domain-containing protein, partial [Prevotella sp.]|nr:TonB-dependent receptor plug domain-containing protein [Prevotella sp.]
MNKKRHLIIYIIVMLASLTASGQVSHEVHAGESEQEQTDSSTSDMDTPRHIFNKAESDYNIGRTEQAFSLLHDNINRFQGDLKQSVLRLMALCCLNEDREDEARYYTKQLIRLNNFYNAVGDPPRFQDLLSQLKGGVTRTITTASSQSESINEAPSPITIITADMIDELGYNKNLNQILAAYVPGIAEMCSMEEGVNLSMHGAHAMGQELILIMENGHRLNTRYDNIGPTNYSISTEKIDHIEVLRGPASSLYGNVAVSAVVNIITKSGRDTNGIKVKYGYATYGTHKADLTIGTQFLNSDIFAWASIYKSDGQERNF